MAATTMLPTNKLLQKLHVDYPELLFAPGEDFMWSSRRRTVYYAPHEAADLLLLHELGHAIKAHEDFAFDIELIAQEREAWDIARSHLAQTYEIVLDEELIENALDTYRNWLHARSTCPTCDLTGIQTKTSTYVCVNCRCSWRPNDARRCALRRYVKNN